MTRHSLSNAATEISHPAAAIHLRIGVYALPIISAARYADAVIAPHHRREIANDHRKLITVLAASEASDSGTPIPATCANTHRHGGDKVRRGWVLGNRGRQYLEYGRPARRLRSSSVSDHGMARKSCAHARGLPPFAQAHVPRYGGELARFRNGRLRTRPAVAVDDVGLRSRGPKEFP
jgi:hypothetical protein